MTSVRRGDRSVYSRRYGRAKMRIVQGAGRPGDPRPARDEDQDVHRRRQRVGAFGRRVAEPNSLVDPVILGLPGVLPVMNKQGRRVLDQGRAWRWAARSPSTPSGTARATTTPTCRRTTRSASTTCRCAARARSSIDRRGRHDRSRSASAGRTWKKTPASCCTKRPAAIAIDHCIVDLNRAGTPLLEIVTEPDLHDAASRSPLFGQELQKLVQFLGVSEAQMQMGHMRFEPNINVHITDARRQRPQDRHHRDQEPQQLQRARAGDGLRDPAADPRSGNETGELGKQEHLRLGRSRPSRPSSSATRKRPTTTATSPTPTSCRSR